MGRFLVGIFYGVAVAGEMFVKCRHAVCLQGAYGPRGFAAYFGRVAAERARLDNGIFRVGVDIRYRSKRHIGADLADLFGLCGIDLGNHALVLRRA